MEILKNSTPLEWNDLWQAISENPGSFVQTTVGMYDEMLGCLPPAAYGKHGAFAFGEAKGRDSNGNAIYAVFMEKEQGICHATYMTIEQFEKEFC